MIFDRQNGFVSIAACNVLKLHCFVAKQALFNRQFAKIRIAHCKLPPEISGQEMPIDYVRTLFFGNIKREIATAIALRGNC